MRSLNPMALLFNAMRATSRDRRIARGVAAVAIPLMAQCGVDDVRAAKVADLYSAETIVTGTEEPERSRGFGVGLLQVVIKLTGLAALETDRRLVSILPTASRYVATFSYEDRMKDIPVHDEQGTRERPHFLRVHFDKAGIDQMLRKLGLPKWSNERPRLTVWLAIRTARGSYVLSADGDRGYGQREVFKSASKRRGVPILIPDRRQIEAAGTGFNDIVANSIERSGSDEKLIGVLETGTDGYWDVRWHLTAQQIDDRWAETRVTFDTAIRGAIDRAAALLSAASRAN